MNLSSSQILRLYALANAFGEVIASSISYLAFDENEAAWNELAFVIDRVHQRANSREEQVFETILAGWLAGWSDLSSFGLRLSSRHTSDLTVMRKYCSVEGFDLYGLLRGNMHWQTSSETWGLQVADMAAAIIGHAVSRSSDPREVRVYEKLMRASFYPFFRGPGVIALDEENPVIKRQYGPLTAAVFEYQRRLFKRS